MKISKRRRFLTLLNKNQPITLIFLVTIDLLATKHFTFEVFLEVAKTLGCKILKIALKVSKPKWSIGGK